MWSCILPGLPTHLLQELNVGTVCMYVCILPSFNGISLINKPEEPGQETLYLDSCLSGVELLREIHSMANHILGTF